MARGGFFAVDSLTSVHILVVDDDVSFRDVIVALLRYCGALVTPVGTAEEAKALVEKGLKAVAAPTASSKEKWPDKTVTTTDWKEAAKQLS